MILHIEISQIYQKELLLTKYFAITHSKLVVILRYQLDWHQSFDKKVEQIRTGISYNQELGNELHKPMIL